MSTIKVLDYGTNDAAVRAAVDAAKAQGAAVLYFGPGTYTVDGTAISDAQYWLTRGIVLDFPVTIHLHPDATIQHVVTPRKGYCVFDVTGSRGVTFCGGGKIRGDYGDSGAGTNYGNGFGIRGDGVSGLTLQDITITNFRGDCVGLGASPVSANQSIRFERVTISRSTRNGVSVGAAHRVVFLDSVFENNGLETMPRADIDIEGNGGATDIARGLWVHGCTFSNTPEQALVISSSIHGARITSNTFTNSKRSVHLSSNCLSASDVVIAGNVIQGGAQSLMGVALGSPTATGVVVENNRFNDMTFNEPNYSAAVFIGGAPIAPRFANNVFTNCLASIKKYGVGSDVVNPILAGNQYIGSPAPSV